MKKFLLIAAVALGCSVAAARVSDANIERARNLVAQMTLDEKIDCLSGKTSFSLRENQRLGIPSVLLADGPQGVRNHAPHSTLYPCGVLLASTWNRDLARSYGASLGDDARARGVGIMLGPGVNIYRSPLCGRNYEYMGEDPYLTSEIAADYIRGVQSRGVIATVKHFAGNNQEWSRHHVSSDIDERTLHEIYLPAFRKAVQEAGVGAVMDSYNLVNGVHATENPVLNIDILRDRWGFRGILMSDWTSTYSTVGTVNGGLDLEMPKRVWFTPERIKAELAAGRITEQAIDEKVVHILSTFDSFGLLDREQRDSAIDLDCPSSRATALDVAREGIVLLKNEDGMLPLRGRRTLVLGPNCDTIVSGGGSGSVSPFSVRPVGRAMRGLDKRTRVLTDDELFRDITGDIYTDSTLTQHGLTGRYYKNQRMEGQPDRVRVDSGATFHWKSGAPFDDFPADHFSVSWTGVYVAPRDARVKLRVGGDDGYRVLVDGRKVAADWGNHSYSSREVELELEAGRRYDIRVDYFDNISDATIDFSMRMLDDALLERELRRADNVVFCTGFNGNVEGEGFDRSFALPEYQQSFIRKVAALNPRTCVVLNAGGGVEFGAWADSVPAILMAWYPGQEGGTAVAEILTGRISPSGKLPISIENRPEDNPCAASYYKNIPYDREIQHVDYSEGVFCGYRGYARNGVRPRYPFGFGLSYSTFAFSDLALEKTAADSVRVSFTLTNTGRREAAEVAQVYVGDTECSVPRPALELKAFEKVLLRPGESRRVSVELGSEAFAFYDLNVHDFRVEPGVFRIAVGNSSDNLPLEKTIEL